MIGCPKKNLEKIVIENAVEQKENKAGLTFNPSLALSANPSLVLGLQTTGPGSQLLKYPIKPLVPSAKQQYIS